MSATKRNMTEYVKQYKSLPFEPIQIEYRRKLVLSQVRRLAPSRLLEVGCGEQPLFTDLPEEMEIAVVEPAQIFADHARKMSIGRNRIRVLQGLIESVDLGDEKFDMIILSCVLHEVPDPIEMLRAIHRYCSPSTILHVNVPNARSLHRLLAVAMGLIQSPTQQSQTQRLMQQRDTPYDSHSLRAELSFAGFDMVEEGGLFVKPFTHSQMQELIETGFMTQAMLDGLDNLINLLPDIGSEIWVNARRSS